MNNQLTRACVLLLAGATGFSLSLICHWLGLIEIFGVLYFFTCYGGAICFAVGLYNYYEWRRDYRFTKRSQSALKG